MERQAINLPAVWSDDTRMSVLFAPFREKSLNPSSWKQKMSFWSQLILEESRSSLTSIIDLNSLQIKFTRNGKVPLCLDVVLEELLRSNTIKMLSNTGSSPVKQRPSWLTWGYDTFLKTPVKWGINYMSSSQTESKDTKYIVIEVLHKKCEQIVQEHQCGLYCEVTDSVIEYSQLWKKSQSLCERETEFDIILEELVKQRKVTVHHENTHTIIKFVNKGDKTVKPVSKRDMEIFRIKMTRDVLTDKIDSLTSDIDKLKKEALRVKKTSKTQALRCLRQKRIIESRIDKLTGSLDILDNILNQISHSVSDEMVVKALESGNNLAEVLEQQAEIQDQISSGPSGLDISREELEAELEDIMKDEIKEQDSELLIDDIISGLTDLHLPKVPSASIDEPVSPFQTPEKVPVTGISTSVSPQKFSKAPETSPQKLPRPNRTLEPPQISQSNLYKQSPVVDGINNGELDLSLELPDVPTFTPYININKKEACLDS
ncbi:CHMP7 [Mytilus coruscus]|uniref:Charged multivesicular body protein 7 n=1 Tax=Mytilus coruscus TaxID=42192 RepID=A0A6J8DFY3_MYTCO|nr:CHMP7 [Mytilus coruscus]